MNVQFDGSGRWVSAAALRNALDDRNRLRTELAGVVEKAANICKRIADEGDPRISTQAARCEAAIRALTTAPKEPAPVAQDAEALARQFHDTYERLAPQFGYETRQDTRQFDPESANGKLMIAVCREIVAARAGKREGEK